MQKSPTYEKGQLQRRTGIAFWLLMFAVAWTVVEAVASYLLPVHLLLYAAGFLGAFLGSSPLILIPTTARLAFGTSASLGDPRRREGRFLLGAVAVLTSVVLALHVFPHEGWTRRGISELGLLAAVLAGAFSSEFAPAGRRWLKCRFHLQRSTTRAAHRRAQTRRSAR